MVKFIYDYSRAIHGALKAAPTTEWSNKLNSFYLVDDGPALRNLHAALKSQGYVIDLSRYEKPKALSIENAQQLEEYRDFLAGLRLSASTILTYSSFVQGYGLFLKEIPMNASSTADFRKFIEHAVKHLDYSISTHRQMISAFKHFMALYPAVELTATILKRPKRDRFKPEVLSMEDVLLLIQVTHNLKHRFIIAMLYSCGLRIGELLSMQVSAVDLHRKQVLVKMGKGRKDRYVSIAHSMEPLVNNYMSTYQPKGFLIGSATAEKYSSSSVRAFLKVSCRKAGILKRVTPHTLRHSYATHMLENGVGLRHIQELLGHSKPETTMLYTHIARKDLLQITNPLDVAIEKTKPDKANLNLRLS